MCQIGVLKWYTHQAHAKEQEAYVLHFILFNYDNNLDDQDVVTLDK